MTKVCECCGKKHNSFLWGEPFYLTDEKILCIDCSSGIYGKIQDLCFLQNRESFNKQKEDILDMCHQRFDNNITNCIIDKIEKIQASKEKLFETNEEAELAKKIYKEKIENHMLTTGYDFVGFTIKKYLGVVSGQVVLGTGFLSEFTASFADFFGTESNKFANKLDEAKNAAIQKLINKSTEKGGNALIGVDFDYVTFSNNMIGVIANGTSVEVDKYIKNTEGSSAC